MLQLEALIIRCVTRVQKSSADWVMRMFSLSVLAVDTCKAIQLWPLTERRCLMRTKLVNMQQVRKPSAHLSTGKHVTQPPIGSSIAD